MISIEPDPDDSSAPFTLKPLAGAIAADVIPPRNVFDPQQPSELPHGDCDDSVAVALGQQGTGRALGSGPFAYSTYAVR